MKKLHLCFLLVASSLFVWGCGDDSASNANNENGGSNLPPQQGTEIPCDAGNEGLEIKPADSENPRVCTNGTWVEILSSSSATILSSSSATILSSSSAPTLSSSSAPTEDLSSSSANPGQAGNEVQSSSSVTQNSSSSDVPKSSSSTILNSSSSVILSSSSSVILSSSSSTPKLSSSSTPIEDLSSSSEESKMYLCDDGVTYVLDLANCANSSSSSSKTPDPAEESSSSTPILSSSSTLISSSSSTPIEDSNSSSSSVVSSSSSAVSSSSVQSSSSSIITSSSSSIKSTGICKTATEDNCDYGTLVDERDGKIYKTVKIGEQEWMAENLNFKGDSLHKYYNFCKSDSVLCARYGHYYTWVKAIDSASLYAKYSIECGDGKKCSSLDAIKIQGVCPNGWHIPNQNEWKILINFVGASKAGNVLKSSLDWKQWPGEDLYGFSVLPSGYVQNASIGYRGNRSYIWTSSDDDRYVAKCVQFNYSQLRKDEILIQSEMKSSAVALPVRCIKD